LVSKRTWAEGLITLELDARLEPFSPGQFVMLGYNGTRERIERAYSLASAPDEAPEFLLTHIEGGALTPHLFRLEIGDELWATTKASGQFTLENVQDAKVLWMLATGTGIAPYISMLRTDEPWRRFERIVLVHGARLPEHLAYRDEILARSGEHGGALTWIGVLSRSPSTEGVLHGRIPQLVEGGQIETLANASIERSTAQVLLCGHPEMIKEMRALLESRGLERNRRRSPGHITTEAFW
jgi:ferredoxin--NADP+ reductase